MSAHKMKIEWTFKLQINHVFIMVWKYTHQPIVSKNILNNKNSH